MSELDPVDAPSITTANPVATAPSPSGSTRLFAILGDPVSQVQAPTLMNRQFLARGLDALMVAAHANANDLDAVVEGLKRVANLDGLLITVPHKFDIVKHADTHSVTVKLAGSANALRREPDGWWHAENFDGLGFVDGLRGAGFEPRGMRVALVGAGGAGVAIAAALVQAGITSITVSDLAVAKAADLAARLNAHRTGIAFSGPAPILRGVDLVINATPLGLTPADPMPFQIEGLHPDVIVADIIMKPAQTRLLEAAAAAGLRTHAGIHMLSPQIAMYLKFFRA